MYGLARTLLTFLLPNRLEDGGLAVYMNSLGVGNVGDGDYLGHVRALGAQKEHVEGNVVRLLLLQLCRMNSRSSATLMKG